VGTVGGLVRLRPRHFDGVGTAQGLIHPVVRSISEDATGRIWLGGTSGFSSWDKGRFEEFAAPAKDAVNPVTGAIAVAALPPDGDLLWVGTVAAGAFQWKDGVPSYPFPPKSVGAAVRAICVAKSGAVWFGSEFGLFRWEGGVMKKFGPAEGLGPGYVFDIREGAGEAIWLTKTGTELFRYQKGRFESWKPPELAESLALAVLPDGGETVWLGTLGGGLLRWHNGKFFRFSSEHGLPSDSISQLLDDGLGNLWAGTQQGIFRVEKRLLNQIATRGTGSALFQLFGKADGLPSIECSAGAQPAALRASDGRLWFSTMRGAVVTNPKMEMKRGGELPVRIDELKVDGVSMPEAILLNGPATRLKPGRHTLEFSYSGLSLAAPEKVRYRRRMVGVDKDWVEAGFGRTVSYAGLPPGDYRFEVLACNQDGVWNKEPARFNFSIVPHLWERLEYQLGALVLLIAGVATSAAGVQRVRYRRKVALLEARRALEAERARIARDLHDDLGAGLAQINISSGMVATSGVDPALVGPLLQNIGDRSRELIGALDEIVWAINPKNDTLSSLAIYLCQFAKNFLQAADISCRLDVPLELPDLPLDAEQRHGLFLAFAEAVHNAVRHSAALEVKVGIQFQNDRLTLTVADNGRGLTDQSPADGADGIGNMHQRLSELGGTCQISSPSTGGTEVKLSLPVISNESKHR
jgi:signal transduction histidine kinase/sugar lactone lactonase YvrE